MKKYISISVLIIFLIILLVRCGEEKDMSLPIDTIDNKTIEEDNINLETIRSLEQYGKEQFQQVINDGLIEVNKATVISDLTANTGFYKVNPKEDYDEETNTLTLTCYLTNYSSTKIHEYYTSEDIIFLDKISPKATELLDIMRTLYYADDFMRTSYEYKLDNVGTVKVNYIDGHYLNNAVSVSIIDQSDFRYIYSPSFNGMEWLHITTYLQESTSQSAQKSTEPPAIGMTADEVRNSSWGNPTDINRTTTAYGVSEQWVYSLDKYVYLDDGIVTAIQE